ncbi:hypothetical protein [Lactiplantibacillus plantarum]|uniref:hypothetical protein n=1 Tax=Lactiplantibacillus plantarum TaxID=1590 RepID=UPI001BAB21A0|nr:hypothetical protein [Lactiplantibacillus plantarum]MBS0955445.1 hypothetical protein [Lactiplantibacillus plantarum]
MPWIRPLFFDDRGGYQLNVITALLALFGVAFGIDSGKKNELEMAKLKNNFIKEQNESQNEFLKKQSDEQNSFKQTQAEAQHNFEKEMTQKKIDANLKAKARIDWIENVRKNYSEYVAALYNLIDLPNRNQRAKGLILLNKYKTLVELYFGNDGDKRRLIRKISFERKTIVYKKDAYKNVHALTNKGKNEYITDYIDAIADAIKELTLLEDKEISITFPNKEISDDYNNEGTPIKNVQSASFINGVKLPDKLDRQMHNPMEEKTIGEMKYSIDRDNVTFTSKNHALIYEKMISDLNDAVRLYLKLEWEVARDGN